MITTRHIEQALPSLKGTKAEELAYIIHTRLLSETSTVIKATYDEVLTLTEELGTHINENEQGMFIHVFGDNASVIVEVND